MSSKPKNRFFLLITLFLSCIFIQHAYGQVGMEFPPIINPPNPGSTSIPATTTPATTSIYRTTSSIRTTVPSTSTSVRTTSSTTSVSTTTTSIACVYETRDEQAWVGQPGWFIAEDWISGPYGEDLAVDNRGNFYFVRTEQHQAYMVTAEGVISVVAGTAGFA